MSDFSNFINEAQEALGSNPTGPGGVETPAQKAARLGLVSDGHGSFSDNTGKIVARTINGELVFYDGGAGGGATSDSEGGEEAVADEQQSATPTYTDPDTGMVIVPPAAPDTAEAEAAVPDPVPATAPQGYQDAIDAKKDKAKRKNDLVSRMAAAFDTNFGEEEDSVESRRAAVDVYPVCLLLLTFNMRCWRTARY